MTNEGRNRRSFQDGAEASRRIEKPLRFHPLRFRRREKASLSAAALASPLPNMFHYLEELICAYLMT
ncbi:hypothetical protein P8452_26904 [Trifolium repens]|nr:hypothetical protein P8452_26904 [Trifolium repens]